jgi:hypothetical protein
VLKDVTLVGVLGGSAGLAGAIESYAAGQVDSRSLIAAAVALDQAARRSESAGAEIGRVHPLSGAPSALSALSSSDPGRALSLVPRISYPFLPAGRSPSGSTGCSGTPRSP